MTLIIYGSEYHPHQAIIHKVLLISQHLVDDIVKSIAVIMKHFIPLHSAFISSDSKRKKVYGLLAGNELMSNELWPGDTFQSYYLSLGDRDKDMYEKNLLHTRFYTLNYYKERSIGYYLDNPEFNTIHYGCLIKKIHNREKSHYLYKCGKKGILFYEMEYLGGDNNIYNTYTIHDVKDSYSYTNGINIELLDKLSVYEFNNLLLRQLFKRIPDAEIVSNIGFISLTS